MNEQTYPLSAVGLAKNLVGLLEQLHDNEVLIGLFNTPTAKLSYPIPLSVFRLLGYDALIRDLNGVGLDVGFDSVYLIMYDLPEEGRHFFAPKTSRNAGDPGWEELTPYRAQLLCDAKLFSVIEYEGEQWVVMFNEGEIYLVSTKYVDPSN